MSWGIASGDLKKNMRRNRSITKGKIGEKVMESVSQLDDIGYFTMNQAFIFQNMDLNFMNKWALLSVCGKPVSIIVMQTKDSQICDAKRMEIEDILAQVPDKAVKEAVAQGGLKRFSWEDHHGFVSTEFICLPES